MPVWPRPWRRCRRFRSRKPCALRTTKGWIREDPPLRFVPSQRGQSACGGSYYCSDCHEVNTSGYRSRASCEQCPRGSEMSW